MQTKTNQATGFLLLYFISSGFYGNRILSRFVFQNVGKYGWLFIWLTALLMVILSVPCYRLISKAQATKESENTISFHIMRIALIIYLAISIFLCISFLVAIINTGWLPDTAYTFIIIPILAIIYYILQKQTDVLLRLATIFFYPIMVQYLLFVFAKNKCFDLYAVIPYFKQASIHPMMAIFACLNIILEAGMLLFYVQKSNQPIKKKPYYLMIFFMAFSLCFDSFVATGQFGELISDIPFAYYESWRLINFGKYIAYLDIFAFFYWVLSAFCHLAISFWLIRAYGDKKQLIYRGSYLFLWLFAIYILGNASLYTHLREWLLKIGSISLLIALSIQMIQIRKLGKHD